MNETTSETVELTITRIFDAPRELVFRCMTEPEHLTHFWGPTGVSTPLDRITIDPQTVADTLCALLNYQDDVAAITPDVAARLVREAQAEQA